MYGRKGMVRVAVSGEQFSLWSGPLYPSTRPPYPSNPLPALHRTTPSYHPSTPRPPDMNSSLKRPCVDENSSKTSHLSPACILSLRRWRRRSSLRPLRRPLVWGSRWVVFWQSPWVLLTLLWTCQAMVRRKLVADPQTAVRTAWFFRRENNVSRGRRDERNSAFRGEIVCASISRTKSTTAIKERVIVHEWIVELERVVLTSDRGKNYAFLAMYSSRLSSLQDEDEQGSSLPYHYSSTFAITIHRPQKQ